MPIMMMSSSQNQFDSNLNSARNRGISNDFESVPYHQEFAKTARDTHSIAIGGNETYS